MDNSLEFSLMPDDEIGGPGWYTLDIGATLFLVTPRRASLATIRERCPRSDFQWHIITSNKAEQISIKAHDDFTFFLVPEKQFQIIHQHLKRLGLRFAGATCRATVKVISGSLLYKTLEEIATLFSFEHREPYK